MEGESLLRAFSGTSFRRRSPLYWEHYGNRAVRDGDWKLVALKDAPWELYDLAADRTELRDLAQAEPGRTSRMERMYEAWAKRCGVLTDEKLRRRG
jgi:arylsulfatase